MTNPNDDERIRQSQANLNACAWNAAVNHGTQRGIRKMGDLIRAINQHERVLGRVKLEALVEAGVIEGFTPCPAECEMRPGGLFHADGCENGANHEVYRERQRKAMNILPGGRDGNAGWRAAYVSLVGGTDA